MGTAPLLRYAICAGEVLKLFGGYASRVITSINAIWQVSICDIIARVSCGSFCRVSATTPPIAWIAVARFAFTACTAARTEPEL